VSHTAILPQELEQLSVWHEAQGMRRYLERLTAPPPPSAQDSPCVTHLKVGGTGRAVAGLRLQPAHGCALHTVHCGRAMLRLQAIHLPRSTASPAVATVWPRRCRHALSDPAALPCPLLQLWRWDPEAGPERRLQQLLLEEPHTVLCSEMVCSVSRWVEGEWGLVGCSSWCAAWGG
jgi:hypothetical protein